MRSCSKTNASGTCYGFQTCDPTIGWTTCDALVPATEQCDGIDNNCNGQVDEGFTGLGACQNSNDFGSCDGVLVCQGIAGLVCQGPQPAAEVCDYSDNDCDGNIDENFKNVDGKYNDYDNCGSCNKSCAGSLPNAATTYCEAAPAIPECRVSQCQDGYFPLNDYQCIVPPDSVLTRES